MEDKLKTADGFFGTAALMGAITAAVKLLGLVRDMLIATSYGTGVEAAAYETASGIPSLIFNMTFGGVICSVLIPVLCEISVREGRASAMRFSLSYINLLIPAACAAVLAGGIFADELVRLVAPELGYEAHALAVSLTRIMLPMLLLAGIAYSFVSVLQAMGEFKIPALMSAVSNCIVVLYLCVANSTFGICGLAVASVVGWAGQAAFLLPSLRRLGWRYRPVAELSSPYLRRTLRGALPLLLGAWANPICTLVGMRYASMLQGGGVSALGYANRLYTIIVGVFTFALTNLLFPLLSEAAASGRGGADRLDAFVRAVVYIIAPISVGLTVMAEPVTYVIYRRGEFTAEDTVLVAKALAGYSAGMIFFAVNEVYVRCFYAEGNTVTPTVSALISAALGATLVPLAARYAGLGGIAMSSGAAALLALVLNRAAVRGVRRERRGANARDIVSSVCAAVLMGAVMLVMRVFIREPVAALCGIVPVAAAVYFLVTLLLRSEAALLIASKIMYRAGKD